MSEYIPECSVSGLESIYRRVMIKEKYICLGPVQTPYFTWAESNANEIEQRIFLICIRFGSCEVRRLNLASVSWQHGNYRSFYASSKVSPLHTIHSALDLNYAYLWCLSCVLYLKERYPISGPNNDSLQWFFVNVGKPRRKIIRRKYKLHVRGKRLKGNASNIWVQITRKNFKDV